MSAEIRINRELKRAYLHIDGEVLEFSCQSAAEAELVRRGGTLPEPVKLTPDEERKLSREQRKERAQLPRSRSLGGRYS